VSERDDTSDRERVSVRERERTREEEREREREERERERENRVSWEFVPNCHQERQSEEEATCPR
jgi:hypothetical protein